jgi:hypothetical protein
MFCRTWRRPNGLRPLTASIVHAQVAVMRNVTKAIAPEVSFWDMLKATTGLFDILFFLLAIGAAHRIAANGELGS